MSDMLERYKPDADDAMKLAIRAQHIERWKSPRNAYPMDRIGYLKWRKDLYKIQANTAAKLLLEAGLGDKEVDRVRNSVAKKNIKGNPDTQLLEDVTDLVFMEHYMQEFVGQGELVCIAGHFVPGFLDDFDPFFLGIVRMLADKFLHVVLHEHQVGNIFQ